MATFGNRPDDAPEPEPPQYGGEGPAKLNEQLEGARLGTEALPEEIISQEDLGVMGAGLTKQHAAAAQQGLTNVAARTGDTANPAFAALAARTRAGAGSSAANALANLKIEATAANVEQAMRRQSMLNALAGVGANYDIQRRGIDQRDRQLDQADVGLAQQMDIAQLNALVNIAQAYKGAKAGSPGYSAAYDALSEIPGVSPDSHYDRYGNYIGPTYD